MCSNLAFTLFCIYLRWVSRARLRKRPHVTLFSVGSTKTPRNRIPWFFKYPRSIIPIAGTGRILAGTDWNRSVPACSVMFLATGFRPVFRRTNSDNFPVGTGWNAPEQTGIRPSKNRPESGCKEHDGTYGEPAGSDRVRTTWASTFLPNSRLSASTHSTPRN